MIGFLSGVVQKISKDQSLIKVGGVGYLVHHPARYSLDGQVELYIHTHVREDAITLFGFLNLDELNFYNLLTSVSGIGAKTALSILNVASVEELKKMVSEGKLVFFTSIPGIGKKTAQRLLIDLKPKLSKSDLDLSQLEGNPQLLEALSQFGFVKAEIVNILPQIDFSQDLAAQIKQALKYLRP